MLNLLRVELRKLLRGKAFWTTVGVYCVSLLSTYIPLSFMEVLEISHLLPQNQLTAQELVQHAIDISEVNAIIASLQSGGNFIAAFNSSGVEHYLVSLVFITIFILSDFGSRTLQNTLLCGYSRRQLYCAKLISAYVGGCIFCAVAMVNAAFLGLAFYHMPLNSEILSSMVYLTLGQCVVMMEFVAVYTCFALAFGNGWSILASVGVFTLLPGIPILLELIRGSARPLVAAHLPSVLSLGGIGGFVTLDMMLALPEQWTLGFVISALATLAVITAASTALGLRLFNRKQL